VIGDRGETEAADTVADLLDHSEPRLRFAAAQALRQMDATEKAAAIAEQAQVESDRLCYYVQWKALRALWSTEHLRSVLSNDERENVRRAALLALLENDALSYVDVATIQRKDPSSRVQEIANKWLEGTPLPARLRVSIEPTRRLFRDELTVRIARREEDEDLTLRYTTDGSPPTPDAAVYDGPFAISSSATVTAGLFRDGTLVGSTSARSYEEITGRQWENDLFVHDLTARADGEYRGVRHGLKEGAPLYTDRDLTYEQVPTRLRGATYVRTVQANQADDGEQLFQFSVNQPVEVYLAYDAQTARPPAWVRETYERTDLTLQSSEGAFRLYRATFEPGPISFGPNGDAERAYQVVVVHDTGQGGNRTSITEAMIRLEEADLERGRELYFGKAACFTCHRLEGQGQAVGPDLSDIGVREDARYIVASILEPSAVIIEGYHQESVRTTDGEQYFGMVRGETGQKLTLFTLSGRQEVDIPKDQIESRKKLTQSGMPASYPLMLSPQEVADLAAYLRQQEAD